MNATTTARHDFRKMYEDATKTTADVIKKNKDRLNKRLATVKRRLDKMEIDASSYIETLLSTRPFQDDVERDFIEKFANKLKCDIVLQCVKEARDYWYDIKGQRFENYELKKKAPYRAEFQKLSNLMKRCEKKFQEFQAKLQDFSNEPFNEWMNFIRQRAEFLISQFSELGVYNSILLDGVCLVYLLESKGSTVADKSYVVISIAAGSLSNDARNPIIPFVISIQDQKLFEAHRSDVLNQFSEDMIAKEYSDFYDGLAMMMHSLLDEVSIEELGPDYTFISPNYVEYKLAFRLKLG